MKERPILFSGPMVRALLAGRKTQTRRLLNPQPVKLAGPNFDGLWSDTIDPVVRYFGCPHGRKRDRLWVRETFAHCEIRERCYYAATEDRPRVFSAGFCGHGVNPPGMDWTPSIFMPRKLSRILLEIVSVRVERLQNITEEDAKAEGARPTRYHCKLSNGGTMDIGAERDRAEPQLLGMKLDVSSFGSPKREAIVTAVEPCYREAYAELWDQINGEGAWDLNPWVWVVEFSVKEGHP